MRKLGLAFGAALVLVSSGLVHAAEPVTPQTLVYEISKARLRVKEFQFIAEWAEVNQRTVYLAGGTASGFAVYVKEHIEQERARKLGQKLPYFDSRFTWNYFDIYRSTQDADIVVDGEEADARSLESALAEKFPYLQGRKSDWEVRLLRSSRGSPNTPGFKDPLVGKNGEVLDFQKQHSDSYSMGLISISDEQVRDLSDWESEISQFLKDLSAGKISYYYRATHEDTPRYRNGFNPEILSVIRVLTKSFQYGAELRPESLAIIRKVVDRFSPRGQFTDYARHQIQRNALKLFWHSKDLEGSAKLLDELGLRQKLIQMGGDAALWLNKQPLVTRPLGRSGKRAKELGIDLVSHETNSFLAFENITFSPRGAANVFISRKNVPDEAAIHGNGFYTRMGKAGARGTGLTIRFRVHPDARLNVDFLKSDDYIIVLNRAALQVVDETVQVSPLHILTMGGSLTEKEELGRAEKFKLRARAAAESLGSEELKEIRGFIDAEAKVIHDRRLKTTIAPRHQCFTDKLDAWFKSGISGYFPFVNKMIFDALFLECQIQIITPSHDRFWPPKGVDLEAEAYRIADLVDLEFKQGSRTLGALLWIDFLKATAVLPEAKKLVPIYRQALALMGNCDRSFLESVFKSDQLADYHAEFYELVKQSYAFAPNLPKDLEVVLYLPKSQAFPLVLRDTIGAATATATNPWALRQQILKYAGTPELYSYAIKIVEAANTPARLEEVLEDLREWKDTKLVSDVVAHYLATPGRREWLNANREALDGAARDAHELIRSRNMFVAPNDHFESIYQLIQEMNGWKRVFEYTPMTTLIDRHPEWLDPWLAACEAQLLKVDGYPLACLGLVRNLFTREDGIRWQHELETRIFLHLRDGRHPEILDEALQRVFLGPHGHLWPREKWLKLLGDKDYFSPELTRKLISFYLELRPDATFDSSWMAKLIQNGDPVTLLADVFERYPALIKPEWLDAFFVRWIGLEPTVYVGTAKLNIGMASSELARLKSVLESSYAYRGLDANPVWTEWYDRFFSLMLSRVDYSLNPGLFEEFLSQVLPLRPDRQDTHYISLAHDHLMANVTELNRLEGRLLAFFKSALQSGAPAKFVEGLMKNRKGLGGFPLVSLLNDHPYFRGSDLQRQVLQAAGRSNFTAEVDGPLAKFIAKEWNGVLRDEKNLEIFLRSLPMDFLGTVILELGSHELTDAQVRTFALAGEYLVLNLSRWISRSESDEQTKWQVVGVWHALSDISRRFPQFQPYFERDFSIWIGAAGAMPDVLYEHTLKNPQFIHRADWLLTTLRFASPAQVLVLEHLFDDPQGPWATHPELRRLTGNGTKPVRFEQIEWLLGLPGPGGVRSELRRCVAYLRGKAA